MEKIVADGILALYQNGERIRPEQGYPMRLLLPGFEGNMNVKWLTSLWVTDAPSYTKHESGEYTEILADGSSVKFTFALGVKSFITHPSATMTMSGPGLYEISGLAWSGTAKVTRVDVSADGGQSWAEAELAGPVLSRALTRFRLPWRWDGAPLVLMSRAHDETGATQPARSDWKARYDPSNFLHYNAIQPWQITAEGAVLYAAQCTGCHGETGTEGPVMPPVWPNELWPKSVGKHWPYATTIFDYIRRAMPLNAPKSLSDDEAYALTAFILERNGIIDAGTAMTATTLPEVDMPNRDNFIDVWATQGDKPW